MQSSFLTEHSPPHFKEGARAMDVNKLARDHGRVVFLAAFRILNDHARAEDVQQSVFLRLLERPIPNHRWASIEEPAAYLSVMATRLAIDELRRRRRWRFFTPDEEAGLAGEVEQPPAVREQAVAAQRLRQAIARLPRRQAQCFALRVFEGSELAEIADHLSISANTVSVTLNRAMQSLRKTLCADALSSAAAAERTSGKE